jgi:hypothetical protein
MHSAIVRDVDDLLMRSLTRLRQICPDIVPMKPIIQIFSGILKQALSPWAKVRALKCLKKLATSESLADSRSELTTILLRGIRENSSLKFVTKSLKVIGSIGFSKLETTEKSGPLVFRSSLTDPVRFEHDFMTTLLRYLSDWFVVDNMDATRDALARVIISLYHIEPGMIPEYLNPFLDAYLDFIQNSASDRLPAFMEHLATLVMDAGHVIMNHTTRIFDALEKHWHGDYTREASLVYCALVVGTHGRCETILDFLVPVSFLLLKSKRNAERFAPGILSLVSEMARFAPTYLPQIIDGIVTILNDVTSPVYQVSFAIKALEFIIHKCSCATQVSQIRRCLLGLTHHQHPRWRDHATRLLAELSNFPRSPSTEVVSRSPQEDQREHLAIETLLFHLKVPETAPNSHRVLTDWFFALRRIMIEYSPSQAV